MLHMTCSEPEWNSKAFTHRRLMSACVASSTALCALMRSDIREVSPSISERSDPQHPAVTADDAPQYQKDAAIRG